MTKNNLGEIWIKDGDSLKLKQVKISKVILEYEGGLVASYEGIKDAEIWDRDPSTGKHERTIMIHFLPDDDEHPQALDQKDQPLFNQGDSREWR